MYIRAHVHTLRRVSAHVDMQTYRDERRYARVFFLLFFFLVASFLCKEIPPRKPLQIYR